MTSEEYYMLRVGTKVRKTDYTAYGVVSALHQPIGDVSVHWDGDSLPYRYSCGTLLNFTELCKEEPQPLPSEWTNQKPTADGHYWAHLPFGNFTTIVEVSGGGRTCASVGSEQKVPTEEMCSQWLWMGPLKTPSPPTKKVRTDEMDK